MNKAGVIIYIQTLDVFLFYLGPVGRMVITYEILYETVTLFSGAVAPLWNPASNVREPQPLKTSPAWDIVGASDASFFFGLAQIKFRLHSDGSANAISRFFT